MLRLRAYLPSDRVPEVFGVLSHMNGVFHTMQAGTGDGVHLITADLEPRAADDLFDSLHRLGVPESEVSIEYETSASPAAAARGRWLGTSEALIWIDVVESARDNARIFARFIVYMIVAGVIAGFGVMNKSSILIVGAMAVSPDIYPMSAICVGLVDRRPVLAGRALATLVSGLVLTGVAAWGITALMRGIGYPALQNELGDGGLGVLPTINASTFIVAFAAGVAGMLALESRASAAVGVAISITTIPAISYAGVAFLLGDVHEALIAVVVLGVNVVMVVVAGSLTLTLQRRVRRLIRPGM